LGSTASTWVWGHAEVGFDCLDLGLGMPSWGSTALN
jgi:hypothetical protein